MGEIPREPVPFQERPALAEKVDATLAGERMAVVCALAGGRGVGKTQLAAAVARRRIADGCPLVGWVTGETTGQYLSGLAAIAERLGVADPEGDSVRSARRFREHLEGRTEPALLVVDNAVDPDEVAKFLPTTGTTQVLVTTTDHAFRNLGRLVDVDVYTRPESLDYLREVTGRDDALADVLAEELGDLPLALTQAAAVIVSKPWTYRRYLDELERVAVDQVLRRQDGQPYPQGAAEATLLALDAVESADPTGMVTRVLTVLSVLAADGVPRELLARLAGGGDASRVEDGVEQCVRSSVLTIAGDNGLFNFERAWCWFSRCFGLVAG